VNISAEEGAFPAGTTLVVRSASRYEAMTAAQDVIEDGKKVVDAVAVDISFVKDDAEIQPTDPSLVHVSLSLADALEGTEHEVVHVEDSGETSVVADASATGAQFQSEGFSVYAIIGTEDGKNEEIARATYNFVLDDDTPYYFKDTTGKTTNSQILIEGDKLTAPQDPTKDGASFTGWLLDGKAFDISAFTQAAITADETHTVKASFTDKVYATFYDTDGTTALAKLEPDADGNVIYSGIEAAPDQPHQKFVGWASAPNSTVAEHEGPSGTITGVTQDISLYPVFAPAYTITYSIPHGAQYLAPDTFFTDEATAAPAIYQEGSADLRTGYTFAGWYTDEALKTPYSWGGNLTSDITLYSKWEVSSTTYTVQFWKESLDGDYDFAGKIVENANTGDTAVIADEYKSYGNTKAGVSDFTGFAYDADKTDAEYADLKYKTVSGDGSTVLNVYYKRNIITIRFHYGTLTESRRYEGYYTFDEDRVETYSGKYEQPLDNWPEGSFTELNEYGYGYYTKGSGISFLTAYKLPDNKATEIDYYQEKEGTGSDVYFYLEQADGNYTLAKDYKTDAGSFSITDKYAGYQAHHYKTRSHNNGNNWEQQQQHNVSTPDAHGSYAVIMLASGRYDLAIYFNLKTSMVHFVDTLNSEQDITTQSVKYTAKIADPGNPAVTHDGYTFKGWFKDAGCTVPFDFANEAMPANDLKIYAGWDVKKYSVHLDVNGGTLPEGQTDRFWITFDRKIDPQNPYWTENGQSDGTQVALFTGWTRKNDGTSYTTGKRPTDADVSGEYDWGGDVGTIPEIELTANWKMVGSYTVTIVYTDKDGNPQKVTGASYADGAIAKAPLSVPYTPDGKALTGWTIEKNDTNLSLGQEFIVDAVSMGEKDADGNYVITITPVYSKNGPLDVTSVTFNGNGGTVVGENVVGLAMNGTFTMADATRKGYTLLGWSTNANATEAQFTAGKEYAANDVNGNTLYAVWARDVYVTVTGNTDSKVYSGADQSVTGHTDEFKDIDGNVIDAANFTVTVADSADTATGKDAGIYYMTMSGSDSHQVSAEGASAGKVTVTSNVASYVIKNITVKDGSLTITPIAVELTANSATKEYDGTALTDSGYEITKGAFVSGEGLATVTVVGSQTLAGSSKNKITAHTLKEGTKAENYTITYVDGTLTVTNKDKIKITITADSDEKTYDGSALIKDSYTITSGELKSGDQIASVTVTGSQTDAGTSANVPSAARIMHGSDDVTDYYEISYVNGTLRVKPVAIELTADSDSKEYDGTPLTKNSYKITSGAFVGEDGLASVTVEGSQTLVGSSENKITAQTLKEGTKKDNYTITYVDGKLTVTNENKIKITITADSDEKTYDSTALTKNSYALTAGELKSGDKITSVTVAGSQTDAGTSANKASDAKIMHGDADVTSYYEITYVDGKLKVNPVAIELTADSDSKEYDGTPLTKNSYKITSGAFIGNDGLASVTVEGSQTLVGSSENKITAHTLKEGTKAGNYNITYKPGTLEVTNKNPIEITITADSAEKTYDASALTKDTWKLTSGSLKSGDTITSVTVTGSQTDAGSSDNVPSAAKIMHGDTDVTGYYKITYVNGTLKVNPVAIELTAASDSKEYDGTPLTKNSYEITSGAFIGNDGLASVTVEGSQTLVGSSENKITAHTLKEGTKKDNYTITYVDGKLTVTNENKIKITITADSDEKTYDSTALTKNSYALTAGELKSGDKITSVTVAGSQTDAGTSANKASDAKIMHGDADVTSYYEITYVDGKLKVNPVAIELTADSDSKEYDGTPLTKNSYKITSGKFVGEDGLASVMVEGSQTLVGSSDNTITAHTLKEGTKAENYSITYKPGTLTVTDGTPDEPVDPGKVVTKTHEGNKFKLGETITWTIKVKNIYDEVKTITLTELDGVELKQSVFKDVAAGAEITTTATHVVTEADILNGKFHNDVKVEFSGEDKPFHGEDEPTTEDPKPHITVTKKVTSTPAIGESYVEGETIRYSVTAKNDGNLTLTEVVVTDALTGDSWTIDGSFAPGAEKTFETSYVVTAADAAAGTVKNVATATGKGPDGHDPEVVPGEVEEPTHPKYELAIEANSEKAAYDGKEHTAAGLKETKFTVEGKDYTVAAVTEDPVQTNAGTYTNNIDKASIVVKDADGKDVTALFQVATTDGSLIIGKRKITVTADSDEKKYDGTPLTDPDYSVTEGSLADGDTLTAKTEGSQTLVGSSANRIQEGSVRIFTQRTNAAKKAGLRLFAAAPAGGELTEVTDNYEITTKDGTLTVTDGTADDPVDPTKVVTKSHEGNEFKLGETITWTIKVKNIYDEAKTITLTELDGVELEQSVFENVAAGAEITAVATHVVTEADILSGKFHNDVKAEFSGEDKPFHGEDDPTTEKKNPHITITKTVTNSPKSGDAFVEAETIEYSVAVENDGNVTISNAVVTDELTGDSWTIETLAPGQTNSFEAVYEVTAEDVKAGKVTNVATATGKDPSGDEPEVVPGKAETKTKAKAEPAKPETETPKDGPVAPKTGDNNPLMLYLLLLLGSGAIIGGAQLRRRKREDGAQ
jgi:uncharacterized repeat protein (TIGR02543 family)